MITTNDIFKYIETHCHNFVRAKSGSYYVIVLKMKIRVSNHMSWNTDSDYCFVQLRNDPGHFVMYKPNTCDLKLVSYYDVVSFFEKLDLLEKC